jgi:hypothetical protein
MRTRLVAVATSRSMPHRADAMDLGVEVYVMGVVAVGEDAGAVARGLIRGLARGDMGGRAAETATVGALPCPDTSSCSMW